MKMKQDQKIYSTNTKISPPWVRMDPIMHTTNIISPLTSRYFFLLSFCFLFVLPIPLFLIPIPRAQTRGHDSIHNSELGIFLVLHIRYFHFGSTWGRVLPLHFQQ